MKLVLTVGARLDLKEAVQWYRKQSVDASLRLRAQVDTTLFRIQTSPSQFPPAALGCRTALVEVFPYLIHFTAKGDQVIVVAIAHAKRKPLYFAHRIRPRT